MSEINQLIFNDIEVEDDFRWLLKQRFKEDDIETLFSDEINLVPMDYDATADIDLPAVTVRVEQSGYLNADDEELQTYTPFFIEIGVYTSGKNKVRDCKSLSNIIIKILQSNGQLPIYYCRGLKFDSNNELGTVIDSACRRVIRMSGLCDNSQKLIF